MWKADKTKQRRMKVNYLTRFRLSDHLSTDSQVRTILTSIINITTENIDQYRSFE